ncbi:MAG: 6-carboxytetrahydropterin synthase [Planctomycetota bacterium]
MSSDRSSSRETYRVQVTKDYLTFCSAHFIVYNGTQCERLHGHNYRVGAMLEADLDEDHLVFDFIALKRILREICNELDHRLLVPLESEKLNVDVGETRVTISYQDREWIVPREDCILLPIANSTAELLAKHIAAKLLDQIGDSTSLRVLEVEVEESPGQSGTYRLDPVS